MALPSLEKTIDESNETASAKVYVRIHASVKFSTQPSLPVTLSTWRTPLERDEDQGTKASSPVWINSALTAFHSVKDPSRRAGPPALNLIVHRRGGFTRDLRRSWDFLTVPSAESGQEVVISHLLPLESFSFWNRAGPDAGPVQPEKGEKFVICPSAGALGTFWWRWGDLDGDLAKKMFRADEWFDGENEDQSEVHDGDWVESEGPNGFGLTMEVENEAEVEFV